MPVVLDMTWFGPRRVRWGEDTPAWARAAGFRPDREVDAEVEESLMSSCGDWWTYLRVPLLSGRGEPLKVVNMLVPPEWIRRRR